MPVSSSLLRQLDLALMERNVSAGLDLLKKSGEELIAVPPEDPLAPAAILNLAQWVDLGFREPGVVDKILERFSQLPRSEMKLLDYIQLRLAEAFVAFSNENASLAISILEGALTIQAAISDPKLQFLTHYWKGRAHRQKGEYEAAEDHIRQAKQIAAQMQAPRLIAVVEIHESWLLFQKGQRNEALKLLDKAEAVLKPTGHALSLGNIESARGRFVRRSGEYTRALEHFEKAIEIYSKNFPNHSNLARAMSNAAYVRRLIAFDIRQKAKEGRARGTQHDRYLLLCSEALHLLGGARRIYEQNHHQKRTGSVFVNAGHLYLDSGDIEHALEQAVIAFRLGEEKHDVILMARARTLQAAIENAQVEEQMGEAEEIALHANLAVQFSDEAIALAMQTQNKRLLAGSYIARGATAANDFFAEWEVARQYSALAADLLSADDKDHLSKELRLLKSRILRAVGVDQALRSWSDGLTGDKTFQQVTEEFAEIVIPKVWLREDRKISRVSAKLSISPKKVRRILRNAHLLQ